MVRPPPATGNVTLATSEAIERRGIPERVGGGQHRVHERAAGDSCVIQ
jgi:hypothetical protein